ncbi:MAG TPA: TetR/AcrR family transcriptional regulator [Stellaceae bacterium]|nr:TetR/AcrR family transcriptional regulator [Stellaceae bacterium]
METAEHASRWRRRKAARPAEILAAALDCFAERGFAATRLDDVAHRAGVTKGTLYLYFSNKEELFKAVVNQAVLPNIERAEARIAARDAPAALLLEELMIGWSQLAFEPASAIPKIIVAEAGNFPELARFYREEIVGRVMAVFHRVLRLGIERREFREADIYNTALCIVAPLLLTVLWRHSLSRDDPSLFDPEAICRAHLRLLLQGLTAPVAPVCEATDLPPGSGAERNIRPDPVAIIGHGGTAALRETAEP